jgi:hypothetical protein
VPEEFARIRLGFAIDEDPVNNGKRVVAVVHAWDFASDEIQSVAVLLGPFVCVRPRTMDIIASDEREDLGEELGRVDVNVAAVPSVVDSVAALWKEAEVPSGTVREHAPSVINDTLDLVATHNKWR